MKFRFSQLHKKPHLSLEEEITFSEEEVKRIPTLLALPQAEVEVDLSKEEDFVHVVFHIKAHLVLECAYTLEPVDYPIDFEDELDFMYAQADDEDEGMIYVGQDEVDLDPFILGLIVTEIPLRVIKPGAKLPTGGKGYDIKSEEDYEKERSERIDPRFAKLDEWEE